MIYQGWQNPGRWFTDNGQIPEENGGKICSRCRWYRWCTLTCEYLREFSKKFETILMGYSGAGGKLIHEKTRSKKSRDTVPLIQISLTLYGDEQFAAFCLFIRTLPIDFALLGRKRKYIKSKTIAKLKGKQTSIAAVRGHFLSYATFSTPILSRYRLPLSF